MKYWVGVTDNRWHQFLSTQGFDEVNFWQPSATPPFTNLEAGTPFLFKLKRPNNHIAGLGYFVKYVKLPLTMAWEVFGEKNGASTFTEFENLIRPLIGTTRTSLLEVGCSILSTPYFFHAILGSKCLQIGLETLSVEKPTIRAGRWEIVFGLPFKNES